MTSEIRHNHDFLKTGLFVAALDLTALPTHHLFVAHSEANPGLAPGFLPASSAFCDRWKMKKTQLGWGREEKGFAPQRAPSSHKQVESLCPTITEAYEKAHFTTCSSPGKENGAGRGVVLSLESCFWKKEGWSSQTIFGGLEEGKAGFGGWRGEALVLVALSTRWHPYFLIFAATFSLEAKLVQIVIGHIPSWLRGLNLWSWRCVLSQITCCHVSDRAVFTGVISSVKVGVPLPPLFLLALLLPLRLNLLLQASGKQSGVEQCFSN